MSLVNENLSIPFNMVLKMLAVDAKDFNGRRSEREKLEPKQ
jgi:hypothetical protein